MTNGTQTRNTNVLVTGASSGIGRAIALDLASRGTRVFAGVRNERDAEALRSASTAIVPIMLDVTRADTIAAARDAIAQLVGGDGLAGLVNNAGVGAIAPLEYVSEAVLRNQFEVNVIGQIAVTQAFLPMLRRARGRIINIGSVGAYMAVPFGSMLCASKAALHLLNDALRLELYPFGIHVSLVEPGPVRTGASEENFAHPERVLGGLPRIGERRYGDLLRAFMARGRDAQAKGSDPDLVARAVRRALQVRVPKARYKIGGGFWNLLLISRLLPERSFDALRRWYFGLSGAFGARADARELIDDPRRDG